jgi:hypothetical protein
MFNALAASHARARSLVLSYLSLLHAALVGLVLSNISIFTLLYCGIVSLLPLVSNYLLVCSILLTDYSRVKVDYAQYHA